MKYPYPFLTYWYGTHPKPGADPRGKLQAVPLETPTQASGESTGDGTAESDDRGTENAADKERPGECLVSLV